MTNAYTMDGEEALVQNGLLIIKEEKKLDAG